jgi:hypothetical protein
VNVAAAEAALGAAVQQLPEWAGLVVEELEEMVAVVAAAVLQLAVPQ